MKIQDAQYDKFDEIRKSILRLNEQLGYDIVEFCDVSMDGCNEHNIREAYKIKTSYERNRFNRPIKLNDADIKFLDKIYNMCYTFYKKELRYIVKREKILNETGKI